MSQEISRVEWLLACLRVALIDAGLDPALLVDGLTFTEDYYAV